MLKNIKIIFYIILLNIFSYYTKKIIIPFKTTKNTNSNYIMSLLQNQIYTQLEIGSTKQNIYLSISTETDIFAIESYLINETFYSAKKSTSYTNNTYLYYYENYARMKRGDVLNETFYFQNTLKENDNKNNYSNIMFYYITELSKGYSGNDNGYIDDNITLISGILGLQITRKYFNYDEIIFIKSLKNIDAIDNLVWSISYENDEEGYLIFGEYPHQYESNLTENDYININCITLDYEYYWYFTFTDIKIGSNKMKSFRTCEYAPQLGLIISTIEYYEIIDKYFQGFISLNKCKKKEILYKTIEYYYYECDKNINTTNFEPILFIHRDSNINFTLDKNDLFVEYNDILYFLVIVPKKTSYNQRWVLGKPFVKKYKFAFNHDSKNMLYYEGRTRNNDKSNDRGNKFKNILFYVLICVLGIFVVILGIFIGKLLFGKKKKKKANELEDNINEDNNNSINENNKEIISDNDYNKMGI